jgi:hypothetical protein
MRIYVHTEEKPDPEALEPSPQDTIGAALEPQAEEIVLLEDHDDPLEQSLSLEDAGIGDRAHVFRGRKHRILVVVDYNGEERSREFTASAPVERVFRWAVGEEGFDLTSQDAAEHTLALSDESIPAEDVHIGSLPESGQGRLVFALVPKHRFEG